MTTNTEFGRLKHGGRGVVRVESDEAFAVYTDGRLFYAGDQVEPVHTFATVPTKTLPCPHCDSNVTGEDGLKAALRRHIEDKHQAQPFMAPREKPFRYDDYELVTRGEMVAALCRPAPGRTPSAAPQEVDDA